ncbi:DUF4926 domain-containing protein [Brevibacillus panacihumi]|uniref:DUF4926 domain-containing protein n=1 Tax=Brevibacillus panacihumi TaxID=497735 RepID=UPI003D00E3E3
MFQEYDVVKSIRHLSEKVLKGTIGTILMVFDSSPNQYEVEFVDEENNTLEILTVIEGDIKRK